MKLFIKTTQGTKGSQSAKRLAQALTEKLGYKVFRSTKALLKKQALCYGAGVDKIAQYKYFAAQGIPALEFTESAADACGWIAEGHVVIGRRLIQASCGKGIEVVDPDKEMGDWVDCPVYTKYKKKKREFRVHVYKDKVVRVVEKKLRKDWDGPREAKIRNLANGYVFCGCDSYPEGLPALALAASGVVSSDFAGVDVGYNEKLNELFVIEVNSAPGIEGTNLTAYVQAIIGE